MAQILVIEDEQDIRENIIETLQLNGFDVQGAKDGERGLMLAKSTHPDLVICDIMMPGMDGFAVLAAMREDDSLAAVPFIFLTALADQDSMRHGMNDGADDYIVKPYATQDLVAAVHSRLRRAEAIMDEAHHQIDELHAHLYTLVENDLHTPVETISLVMDAIMAQLRSLEPSQLEDLLDTVRYGSKHLKTVVDRMTYIAQLDSGVLSAYSIREDGSTILLRTVWLAALDMARTFVDDDGHIQVRIQEENPEAQVRGNIAALRHAFAEIIAFNLHHMGADGTVTLHQKATASQGWFTVMCTNRAKAMHIANPEAHTGLVLARRIIEVHGGVFTIDLQAKLGVVIHIRLPLVALAQQGH